MKPERPRCDCLRELTPRDLTRGYCAGCGQYIEPDTEAHMYDHRRDR